MHTYTLSIFGFLLMLVIMQRHLAHAMPWWTPQDASYDASLDPLVWSRAFVQDTVRRSRSNSKNIHNSLPVASFDLGKRRRKAQATHWKYHIPRQQRPLEPAMHFFNTNNYKRFLRRQHKLARDRYGFA